MKEPLTGSADAKGPAAPEAFGAGPEAFGAGPEPGGAGPRCSCTALEFLSIRFLKGSAVCATAAGVDARPRAPQLKTASAGTSTLGLRARLETRGLRGPGCAPPLLFLLLLELVPKSAAGDWERRGRVVGRTSSCAPPECGWRVGEGKGRVAEAAEAASGFGRWVS